MLNNLYFIGMLGGCLGGMLLFGFLINVLLFPSMWQQADVPDWIRLLAGGSEK